jgi:hypothetical protein
MTPSIGVAEIELGGPHRRFRSLYLGLRRVIRSDRRIKLLFAQSVDRSERARPGQITLRLCLGRMRLREPRLRLCERRAVGLWIDFEQDLSVLDRRALERRLPIQDSRHLRSDLDRIRRFELRGILLRQRRRLRPHRQRRHRLRCRRTGRVAPASSR